jgi:hypothetical protein
MRNEKSLIIFVAAGLIFLSPAASADWSAVKRLTWTSGGSYIPSIAVDSKDHVHVVWYDSTPYNYEIYYKKSPDGGATWNPVKRLTWTPGNSAAPAIAIDSSDTLHIVWSDGTPGNYEVYYKRSTDGGAIWSAPKRLTWTSGDSGMPAIAVDSSDTLHIVFYDDTSGSTEIYYKQSTNGGATWSPVRRLTWTPGSSGAPAIARGSGNTIHVVWEDYTPGNQEIYYMRSPNGGSTWTAPKRITWTSTKSYSPVVALDSGDAIHVVWEDSIPGNSEIYYKRSTNSGSTWSAAKRLTWTSGNSTSPAIGRDSSDVIHVVWYDDISGNYDIYYKRSTNGGLTWNPVKRLTWASGVSYFPALALDSTNTVHVVWSDETPGNIEIYYRKGK